MTTEELASRYISTCEQVLKKLQITENPEQFDPAKLKEIIEYAHAYFEDAKYYKREGKFDVSLTSIAYCEGLLDALRLLGTVKFEWPKTADSRAKKR